MFELDKGCRDELNILSDRKSDQFKDLEKKVKENIGYINNYLEKKIPDRRQILEEF